MRSIKLPSWTESLLGLDPVPVPPHVFALDAFPARLRYGGFHRGSQGFVYENSLQLELPDDTFTPGPLGAPLRDAAAFRDDILRFVNGIEGPVDEASLVLPDSWLRTTFIESSELPRRTRDRLDILRWKLKRLVPFRVEDLRISASSVEPFPDQEEPERLLVGFGIELLLSQIEDAFAAAGVKVGHITNNTLALVNSLEHNLSDEGLAALVAVYPDAYALCYFRRREPVLYRFKSMADGQPLRTDAVLRELRLTTHFVKQHFVDETLDGLFLAAHEDDEGTWLNWMSEAFQAQPQPLIFDHFLLTRTQVGPSWLETAPLLGAASFEV